MGHPRKGMFRTLPLKAKLLLIIVAIVVAVSVCVFFWIESALSDSLSRQVEDRSQGLATYLASRSADAILTNNVYELNTLIDDTVKNNEDVKYIFIVGENGEIIADSDTQQAISEELKSANGFDAGKEDREHVRVLNTDKGKVADAVAPAFANGNSMVRVGLGYDSVHSFIGDISVRLLLLDLAILILSLGACYYLVGMMLKPVKNLVALTEEVSAGHFEKRVTDYGKDEIGVLSDSFNHMLDNLQDGKRERDGYITGIKKKNVELFALNQLSHAVTGPSMLEEDFSRLARFIVGEMGFDAAEVCVSTDVAAFSASACDDAGQPMRDGSSESLWTYSLEGSDKAKLGELRIFCDGALAQEDERVFQTLARQMAAIVQNAVLWARLTEKEQALGMLFGKVNRVQEEERKRIARELHDETSHSLTAMLLELQELKSTGDLNREQAACVAGMKRLIDETLEDIKRLAWNLRPNVLDKFGLKVSLERYAESVMEQGPITVDLMVRTGPRRMPDDVEISIYRLVQEAVTNVIKYAGATEVDIMLVEGNGFVSVMIDDNGSGFDVDAVRKSNLGEHLGLIGMEERIALMSGTLSIESSLGNGTSIVAKIPLTKPGAPYNE